MKKLNTTACACMLLIALYALATFAITSVIRAVVMV
jgi:hypothetical protein